MSDDQAVHPRDQGLCPVGSVLAPGDLMIKYIRSWWLRIMTELNAEAWPGSRSATGPDSGLLRAHHEDGKKPIGILSDGEPAMTVTPDTLRDLVNAGVVYAADDDGDLHRVEVFHEEWARREQRGGAHCPCSGHHFPSAGACRWCRCHDPRKIFHDGEPGGVIVTRMTYRPCLICGEPSHSGSQHIDQDNLSADARRVFGTLMDVRPSEEIVKCAVCGHASHGTLVPRCPASVPSSDPSGGIEACRCNGIGIMCEICLHLDHVGRCCGSLTDDGAEQCGCGS